MNWTCPYCNRAQVVTDKCHATVRGGFEMKAGAEGLLGLLGTAIICANEECTRATIGVAVTSAFYSNGVLRINPKDIQVSRSLLPEHSAKPQPAYIPAALREDYTEACTIRELSPKAAATLARRCLQGMIRDFCGISKKTLYSEIKELEAQISAGTADRSISLESVAAIDAVRKVGNIGAHMEADVDHIVPVDAGEAQLLIDLIETLFDEWYVERHRRQQRFGALSKLAADKDELIAAGKLAPIQDDASE